MALRKDPTANAVMAGAFTKSNAAYLTQKLGREPSEGELYMAHFLGAGGAAKLINLASATPNALAKDAFPRAAAANKSIFYGEGGRPRSLSEVTASLSSRYNVARGSQTVPVEPNVASTPAANSRAAQAYAASAPAAASATAVATSIPTVAAVTAPMKVAAAAGDVTFRNPYRVARPTQGPSIQTPAQRAPATVAPNYVVPAAESVPENAVQPARQVVPGEPLNLFQDVKPNVRALFGNG